MNREVTSILHRPYYEIAECTEWHFDQKGDSPLGMGWPTMDGARARYQVMADLVARDRSRPFSLLDFGCGGGYFYEYLQERYAAKLQDPCRGPIVVQYTGLDISPRFVELCRNKYPRVAFYCQDVLQGWDPLGDFDYIVINGVFTSKRSMDFETMFEFLRRIVTTAFSHSRCGLAFNAMSKHVDWERDDLFHLPMDALASFLCREVTRNFVIRNDYGYYEFTTYVYR